MLITNIGEELKKLCAKEKVNYSETIVKVTTRQNFYVAIRNYPINKHIVALAEMLGYDTQIKFVKKKKEEE